MSDEIGHLVIDLGRTVGQCNEQNERIDKTLGDGEVGGHEEDDVVNVPPGSSVLSSTPSGKVVYPRPSLEP